MANLMRSLKRHLNADMPVVRRDADLERREHGEERLARSTREVVCEQVSSYAYADEVVVDARHAWMLAEQDVVFVELARMLCDVARLSPVHGPYGERGSTQRLIGRIPRIGSNGWRATCDQ